MKIKESFNKDIIYFTSDTHFFHKNIIDYCDRPFESTKEMNETLIKKWNEKVDEDDIVFHLGDFSLNASPGKLQELQWRLNGKIYLIAGNHEKDILKKDSTRKRFEDIYDLLEVYVEDERSSHKFQHLVMCHYPMIVWNKSHRGSYQLFGHCHGGLSNKGEIKHSPDQIDVGVDCHNYYPISYREVRSYITKKNLK